MIEWTVLCSIECQSNRISQCKIPVYFAKKNLLFSILHIHFYKILTSVCLFYHLFYLNNNFPHFYSYFISNSLSPLMRLSPFPYETLLSIMVTRRSTLSVSVGVSVYGVFDFVVSVFDFGVDFLFLWLIFDFVSMGCVYQRKKMMMRERRCVGFVDGEEREKKKKNQKLLKY